MPIKCRPVFRIVSSSSAPNIGRRMETGSNRGTQLLWGPAPTWSPVRFVNGRKRSSLISTLVRSWRRVATLTPSGTTTVPTFSAFTLTRRHDQLSLSRRRRRGTPRGHCHERANEGAAHEAAPHAEDQPLSEHRAKLGHATTGGNLGGSVRLGE